MAGVNPQRVPNRLRITPGLHRQHFNALRQQYCRFALHLHPVLQVLNHLDALCQLRLERCQRLFGQRRTGLRSVTLPGQGVGDVQLGHGQQRLGLGGPFRRNGVLPLGTFDLIELFAKQLGCALVASAEFLENFRNFLCARGACQPFPHPGSALPGGRRREGTPGKFIKLAYVVVFWG